MSRRILIAVAAVAVLAAACSIPPSAVTVKTGTVLGGGEIVNGQVVSLRADDDSYFRVAANCDGNFGGCVAEWTAKFNLELNQDDDFPVTLTYTGKNAGAGFQFIQVFNWRTWSWYPIDAFRVVATSEQSVTKTLPGRLRDWGLEYDTARYTSKFLAFVRVGTIGNFTSTSADELRLCPTSDCVDAVWGR